MKIVTIIGARPQFIKAATVSREINNVENVKEILVHTGQHFDSNMSDVFFEEMEIPKPDYYLGVGGGNHGNQTGKMLIKIEEVLLKEKPDWVLVYGDTNSTLAGALAAVKLHIPLAHIEAGLRSFNRRMPEEINRVLTDQISTILFTPTKIADINLNNEGVSENIIVNVGDVMLDASLFYLKKAEEKSTILKDLSLEKGNFVLSTIHRANNTDNINRLKIIFENLERVANSDLIVLPLHPRTKKSLLEINFDFNSSKIKFIEPIGYLDMVILQKNCKLIITDSGGVQKEAYFHKKPCITLRNETEWVELVDKGYNFLWNENIDLIELINKVEYLEFDDTEYLYGNGDASKKIVNKLSMIQV
ncbi:non-hydrolyzing UDP-N-acetylglucosamine 2-epimerase [Aquimarina muelleri]|uniref:UDP-N-acetyl glucosamine 2-epimerase n=1 Tax=Aquimarina muelleri TaxID=279356 RepID=A0A918N4C7_9FLAO|nr:UDP-N-acetylglucosamine 2-epimerase (non-hydrolyzing) [Aquimarina muelleri]MCX2764192.1 UDP-N-acetylglucosamine 2-epimerase (non-hydrolyzing) [Aquimarina muelleri]GGX19494.1 UDP-N-acetyl glucosamine 2-epimerase [Aquimarina muelleri]